MRRFLSLIIFLGLVPSVFSQNKVENSVYEIYLLPDSGHLWAYTIKENGQKIHIKAPVFEIDNSPVECIVKSFVLQNPPRLLKNNVKEYVYKGSLIVNPNLELSLILQISPDNPVLRFQYKLASKSKNYLTKVSQKDNIVYLSASLEEWQEAKEVQFANYDEKYHSYILKERAIGDRYFESNGSFMGPMLLFKNKESSFLLAYEHGSQYGNAFLNFNLKQDRLLSLAAVMGNYLDKQAISGSHPFESLWFEIAGVKGEESTLATNYRLFVLNYMSQNLESRKPYVFYNTWGRQERVKWNGGTYLGSMNLSQTLEEIEKAHQMGIEVFVLDAGWFLKTGDWTVNVSPSFFPDTLSQVMHQLQKHEMKLGLWFNPTVAALSSEMLGRNKNFQSSIDGKKSEPYPIWETEKSVNLCLVSNYWKDYSDVLIKLVEQYGVSYFKWDAIGQGNCNAAGHDHGDEHNSPKERKESNAYLLPIYMSKIIDKVVKACPEAIFDFDITEDGRSVGLGFLSSGKYFAVNNGPYYHNYDISEEWKSPLPNENPNIFVYPGAARGWFSRQVLSYDKWIPSTLFLTHYQPDEPRESQMLNLASLILGQNGIWGEILKTSPEGTSLFAEVLMNYKKIRNDLTLASPVVEGNPGESIEIHEKINPNTGKGAIVIFGNGRREINYISQSKVDPNIWNSEGLDISYDKKGRAVIKANFEDTGAKIIFFGVE